MTLGILENIHTSQTEGVFLTPLPTPLWKFQLSLIHFFQRFGPTEPFNPPGNFNPFCGGVWVLSGTAHSENLSEILTIDY